MFVLIPSQGFDEHTGSGPVAMALVVILTNKHAEKVDLRKFIGMIPHGNKVHLFPILRARYLTAIHNVKIGIVLVYAT